MIRIVFPTNDLVTIESHFGHCRNFKIFNVEDRKVVSTEVLDTPPHQPGLLPRFLGEHKVNVVITGGMGQRAIDLFKEQNIDVILGAQGNMEDILNIYLNGDLYSTGSACSHDHDHGHDHNHNCGH